MLDGSVGNRVKFFKKKIKDHKLVFAAATFSFLVLVVFLFVGIVYNRGLGRKSGSEGVEVARESVTEEPGIEVSSVKDDKRADVVSGEVTVGGGESIHSEKDEVEAFKPVVSSGKDYANLYSDFYTQRPDKQLVLHKTVYLTFDDGPSERTPEVLDILKKYNIKATFFVVGNSSALGKECMKRIVSEGHSIAMHSYTHDFKKIYSSVENYLEDVYKLYKLIHEVTGVKPSIFRFAGGSKNGFNRNNYREIIGEMTRRGFDYFDWNLCNNDAVSRALTPVNKCVDSVLKNSANYDTAVVLMHDSKPKTTTVEALPKIIEGLKEQGFVFEKLSNKISPVKFSLIKPYA